MIATIHQPDFMPWLGFFKKLTKVDTWIVLDHVTNNPRDAAFWGRRVKILVNRKPFWLSIPLKKPQEAGNISVPIKEMRIEEKLKPALEKQLKTIKESYSKTPFFFEISPMIEEYYSDFSQLLRDKNTTFIEKIIKNLKITCKIIYSSDLKITGKSTKLLVDLLYAIGAEKYICGDGAKSYQNDQYFKEKKIQLEYNNFQHPAYQQANSITFVPGLSIIDVVANIGFKETIALLKQ